MKEMEGEGRERFYAFIRGGVYTINNSLGFSLRTVGCRVLFDEVGSTSWLYYCIHDVVDNNSMLYVLHDICNILYISTII